MDRWDFNDVYEFMKPRIDWLAWNKLGYVKGLDLEDIKQELRIELWKKYGRVPHDKLDFRFSRYMETAFRRQLINLRRAQSLPKKDDNKYIPRDLIDHSLPMIEDFEEFIEIERL